MARAWRTTGAGGQVFYTRSTRGGSLGQEADARSACLPPVCARVPLARERRLWDQGPMSDIQETLRETVEKNRVVLFMKGTKNFPQCGFSARAVDILKKCGTEFKDVNVLADPAIRQGIKDFSSWPTIPQVYIGGKFVGGSDILNELFQSGELQKLLTPG
jgi:monothiol glutaredoxin